MSLLMLGAGKGTTLRLVIEGADEENALSEIQALFAAKFYDADFNNHLLHLFQNILAEKFSDLVR